jgi:hypothetical protein
VLDLQTSLDYHGRPTRVQQGSVLTSHHLSSSFNHFRSQKEATMHDDPKLAYEDRVLARIIFKHAKKHVATTMTAVSGDMFSEANNAR